MSLTILFTVKVILFIIKAILFTIKSLLYIIILPLLTIKQYLSEVIDHYIDKCSTNLTNNKKKTNAELKYNSKWYLSLGTGTYVTGLFSIVTIAFSFMINTSSLLPSTIASKIVFLDDIFKYLRTTMPDVSEAEIKLLNNIFKSAINVLNDESTSKIDSFVFNLEYVFTILPILFVVVFILFLGFKFCGLSYAKALEKRKQAEDAQKQKAAKS
jgi:hypothetical protein